MRTIPIITATNSIRKTITLRMKPASTIRITTPTRAITAPPTVHLFTRQGPKDSILELSGLGIGCLICRIAWLLPEGYPCDVLCGNDHGLSCHSALEIDTRPVPRDECDVGIRAHVDLVAIICNDAIAFDRLDLVAVALLSGFFVLAH